MVDYNMCQFILDTFYLLITPHFDLIQMCTEALKTTKQFPGDAGLSGVAIMEHISKAILNGSAGKDRRLPTSTNNRAHF